MQILEKDSGLLHINFCNIWNIVCQSSLKNIKFSFLFRYAEFSFSFILPGYSHVKYLKMDQCKNNVYVKKSSK